MFPEAPSDQSLSDLLYSWKFMKRCFNCSGQSTFTGNSALLPSYIIDFCNVACSGVLVGEVLLLDII